MAINELDFSYDFSGKPDGIWSETGFSNIQNTWSIDSNGLRPSDFFEAAVAYQSDLTSETISAAISIVSNVSSGSDPLAPCLFIAGGPNQGGGYIFEVNGSSGTLRKRSSDSGRGEGIGVAFTFTDQMNGDEYSISYTPSTGELNAYQNDELVATRVDTTHQNEQFYAGIYGNAQNNNGRRVGAFGVGGLGEGTTSLIINSGAGVRAGSTGNTLTTTNGFTPVSGTVGGINLTNIQGTYPDFTFDVPAVGDGILYPIYGNNTATFTNGLESPQTNVDYLPRDGYDYVTLSGNLNTTIDGVVYEFVPAAQAGDQIAFPTPQVDTGTDGSGTATQSGTFQLEHISSVDNTVRLFNLIVGNQVPQKPMSTKISLAGGLATKLSISDIINSRTKLPFIADSEANGATTFVEDLNGLMDAMRNAGWFEEEPE